MVFTLGGEAQPRLFDVNNISENLGPASASGDASVVLPPPITEKETELDH